MRHYRVSQCDIVFRHGISVTNVQLFKAEEVGHGSKGIVVGRISESRTLFYRGHEINMAGF